MNEELLKIFNELLEAWEEAEIGIIQEYSTNSDRDYKVLSKEKNDYIERFTKVLNSKLNK